MLACRTAWAGIELGKELLEMFESSDMMLVLLDTAVRPSLDLYILFRATNRNEDMISFVRVSKKKINFFLIFIFLVAL